MQSATATTTQPIPIPFVPAFAQPDQLSTESPGSSSSCPQLVVSRFSSWSSDEDSTSDYDYDADDDGEDDDLIFDDLSAPQAKDREVHVTADTFFKLDLAPSECVFVLLCSTILLI
jgi:hypothetical protein